MTETASAPVPRLGEPPAGHPGRPPEAPGAQRQGFGTARGTDSHVWFSLAGGRVGQACYPTPEAALVGSCELIVADGHGLTHLVGRDGRPQLAQPDPGVPAYELMAAGPERPYRVHQRVVADPHRDALLIEVRYEALTPAARRFGLYVHLEPLARGHARVEHRGGHTLLVFTGPGHAVALAASRPLPAASVGYLGTSDGRTELAAHHGLAWAYEEALDGYLGLTARVTADEHPVTLALGFGATGAEAADVALAAAAGSFDAAWDAYVKGWQGYLAGLYLERLVQHTHDHARLLRASAAALATLEDKRHPGAQLAAPAAVVRPRDLYHQATARLALGDLAAAARALAFCQQHQRADGAWPNELGVDGATRATSAPSQVAYPILLAWRLREVVDPVASGAWAMARAAALYLARHRPLGRAGAGWRSHGVGTLAAEVAALAAAAELAALAQEPALARYFAELAAQWSAELEPATFGPCTRCAGPHGGHYHHLIAPPRRTAAEQPPCEVDPSCLDLVRFGLRDAQDPRLASSLAAIDSHLRVVAPQAPAWRRYHGETQGDAEAGAWPLLAGERGHHELALGHAGEAAHLLHALERLANAGGLLPEHVAGGGAPHGWAHAEYVKLARSVADGRIFDEVTATRRVLAGPGPRSARWTFQAPRRRVAAGSVLRIEALAPAELRWSFDRWRTWGHTPLTPVAPGIWSWTSPGPLEAGTHLEFTFYWPDAGRWEGRNYTLDA